MTRLMPIGVFARATRLSIRALRNYDRLGLLSPAQVDPYTGYRRYAVDQFAQAGLIRRLRELEVPLTEIAEILAGSPAEAARAAALDRIAERLGAVLEDPLLEVYERWREPQPTARLLLHTSLSGLARALGPAYARLLAGLARQGVAPAGPAGTRYLSDDLDAAELPVEVFVPVERAPRPVDGIEAGQLPGCRLAATVHPGGYDGIDAAYRSLGRWIAEHDRVLAGPAEELYLVPPEPGVPVAALRTEVAWPVRLRQAADQPDRETE